MRNNYDQIYKPFSSIQYGNLNKNINVGGEMVMERGV